MKWRNKWQSGSHPFPGDKCDFQCHLIAQKRTAKRSAFRKTQNDVGDITDRQRDAASLLLRKTKIERRADGERMR